MRGAGDTRKNPWLPVDAGDLEAADARLREAQVAWFDGLNAGERRALKEYTGSVGRLMNRTLRGEADLPEVAEATSMLRGALARASAPVDMLVYRGVGPAELALYLAMARGETMRVTAFLSTSLAKSAAANLAALEKGVVVELMVRRGQRGVAYVHPFPAYQYPQHEVLLNVGSMVSVLHADATSVRLEVGDDGDIG